MAEATMFMSGNLGPSGWRTVFVDADELSAGKVVIHDQPSDGATRPLVACGQAHLWSKIVVVNPETRTCVEDGIIGEIWVSGPHIAAGYWSNEPLTESVFRAKIADRTDDNESYLRTGDLGFLLEGDLVVTGRLKDLIIVRGRNLYPQDMEAAAEKSHSMIRPGCSAAFADEQESGERVVIVAEVIKDFDTALKDEVQRAIRKAIAEEFQIQLDEIVLITAGSIRKTSSGKIQRRATKEDWKNKRLKLLVNGHEIDVLESPAGTVGRNNGFGHDKESHSLLLNGEQVKLWLGNWLAGRAGCNTCDLDEDRHFSELGLDSLSAVELSSDLGAFVGRSLPESIAWTYPTLRDLAIHIAGELSSGVQSTKRDKLRVATPKAPLSALSCPVESGDLARFHELPGNDVFERLSTFEEWRGARASAGIWPYSRALHGKPTARVRLQDDSGRIFDGINFGSIDYLGLSTHPRVLEAAESALRDFGPHSASVPIFSGNSLLTLQLEQELGDLIHANQVNLFSSGWAAGWSAVASLVRESDHVVLDVLAHNCMQHGARSATRNIQLFRHLDLEHARECLSNIRSVDSANGILVVTEGLYSMDSDWPDLRKFQALCHEYDARMLVDISHDIASMGPNGAGMIDKQGMLGEIDLICGGLSKGLAASGGFIATNRVDVKHYIRCFSDPYLFGTSMSPVSAGCALAAIRVARSNEGVHLRNQLVRTCVAMRNEFAKGGIECLGDQSPIIPAMVPDERGARVACKLAFRRGVIANLVEYPAVPIGKARFRLQLMASHNTEEARLAAQVLIDCLRECERSKNCDVNAFGTAELMPST